MRRCALRPMASAIIGAPSMSHAPNSARGESKSLITNEARARRRNEGAGLRRRAVERRDSRADPAEATQRRVERELTMHTARHSSAIECAMREAVSVRERVRERRARVRRAKCEGASGAE